MTEESPVDPPKSVIADLPVKLESEKELPGSQDPAQIVDADKPEPEDAPV